MRAKIPTLVLTLISLCGPALAQSPAASPGKQLQFADIGSVGKWQAGGDRLVYVMANGQWYKVTMLEPCMSLYPGQPLNFITETDTVTNARRSAIDVAHHQCTVTSITKMDQPPPPSAPSH